MKQVLRNRKGLSTVVTTLIILVVSVLLATVVTFYAINVTTTRVQEENLRITKAHIWVNSSVAQVAFVISNIGGRDTLIDKIQVRGQNILWNASTVFYSRTSAAPTADLNYIADPNATMTGATDDLSLKSAECLIMYLTNPGTISVQDVGTTASITVFTASAQYKVEVNVESAS
jgi:hypothetical protein